MKSSFVILTLVAFFNTGIEAKPPLKILNGQQADITEAPFAVMIHHGALLHSYIGLICGGTMITNRHILTAAHCLEEGAPGTLNRLYYSFLRVVPGEESYEPGVRTYEIEKAYIHPKFSGDVYDEVNDRADIAVLKLKEEIPLSSSQKPIELANEELAANSDGLIFGWGNTNPGVGSFSRTLLKSLQKAFDFNTCKTLDPEFGYVKDELCISGNPGTSFCDGDSGGPLIVNGKLAGVLSNSLECGSADPGAVSNVAYYKSWIEDAIEGTAEFREPKIFM